jgi:hypothetical protein
MQHVLAHPIGSCSSSSAGCHLGWTGRVACHGMGDMGRHGPTWGDMDRHGRPLSGGNSYYRACWVPKHITIVARRSSLAARCSSLNSSSTLSEVPALSCQSTSFSGLSPEPVRYLASTRPPCHLPVRLGRLLGIALACRQKATTPIPSHARRLTAPHTLSVTATRQPDPAPNLPRPAAHASLIVYVPVCALVKRHGVPDVAV